MPTIKFWVDGIETVDDSAERPLGDAGRAELERQEHVSKWLKLVERVAGAAAVVSGFIVLLGGGKVPRHRWEWVAIACGGLVWAARYVANRRR